MQGASAGFMIIAIAVAILIAWVSSWWIFFPVLLIEVGAFYTVLGFLSMGASERTRKGPSGSSYYVFWGPTLVILGVIWLLSAETDISGVLLFVIFLLWIGGIAVALSMRRRGSTPQA
ncbi:MAG: hypothetical protein JW880_05905 [Candidatus Thermoplasmatota archaeon]|nr:hypothetical protein [Candidatus Thermoplasmatota archaeon]